MEEIGRILGDLGVFWPNFIAQIIIFLIVYLILKKFAFGPISAILEERRQRIEETERDRAQVKQQLTESQAVAAAKVAEANQRAARMIAEAQESAAAIATKEKEAALREAQDIIAKAREAARVEREQQLATLKKDFGKLVIETTGKVTGKVLTETDQQTINQETASEIAK